MPSTHSLPRKVQVALDSYVMDCYYDRVEALVRQALADVWDEGYSYRDPKNAAPMAGDNPYRDDR